MQFNSLVFLLLFSAILLFYYWLPSKWQNGVLLFGSYIFYAYYDLTLTLFLLICTFFAYFVARMIQRERGDARRAKTWMIIGVVLNLGTLAFYKYFNFLSDSVASILGNDRAIQISFLVPLGISFIIFQTVSYIVDVRRSVMDAEKNFFKFALYVAFFPKVVQGPIERASDILPQLGFKRKFDMQRFREGWLMMLFGLFMKMVAADRIAIVVNMIYADPSAYGGAELLFATVLFSLQIYFDFAGYSLTAIGAARVLGIEMKRNFRQPYLSGSVSEFWRRWHISLNAWLRDYLYIPLGGSRCSAARKNVNTLVTFGFSGLWHGAAWGYIIWGLLNGIYVVAEGTLRNIFRKQSDRPRHGRVLSGVKKFFCIVLTFGLICLSWVFFRAQELPAAATILHRIFTEFDLKGFVSQILSFITTGGEETLYSLRLGQYIIMAAVILVCVVVDILAEKNDMVHLCANGHIILRWSIFYALIFAIIIWGIYGYGYSASSFIYTQF